MSFDSSATSSLPVTRLPSIRVWLGGSFDPVHLGHIAILEHIYQQLQTRLPAYPKQLYLLPTAGSPLKQRPTATHDRLAMLQLACQDATLPIACLAIDDYELDKTPPVYSYHTLHDFAKNYPSDIRIFVMGADSVLSLDRWYRGFELLDFAHLWVVPRAAAASSLVHAAEQQAFVAQVQAKLEPHNLTKKLIFSSTQLADTLIKSPQHHIYIDDFVPPPLSSSGIRAQLAQGETPTGLSPLVRGYIAQHHLYT